MKKYIAVIKKFKKARVVLASELNRYDIMNTNKLMLLESSIKEIEKLLNIKMNIVKNPIITEKMTDQSEKYNRFAFVVDKNANKIEIKKEVEKMYDVVVTSIKTMVCIIVRKELEVQKSGMIVGKTSTYKKAIVTLAEGDSIDFYSNI